MNFLFENYFYWLALLLIPILIHLLFFRKYRDYYFSNVQELSPIILEQNKIKRIRHWVVLATRILAFLFIILAFAQPQFDSKKSGQQHVVFLVDNTPSTLHAEGNISVLEQMKVHLMEALKKVPQDNLVKILTPNSPFLSATWLSPNEVMERIPNLTTTPNFFNFNAFQALFTEFEEVNARLFILSDFQKNPNWKNFTYNGEVFGVHYGTETNWLNYWVEAINPKIPLILKDKSSDFLFSLKRNYAGRESMRFVLRNEQGAELANENVEWNEGQVAQTISVSVKTDTTNQPRFNFLLQSKDLLFDNRRWFIAQTNLQVGFYPTSTQTKVLNDFYTQLSTTEPTAIADAQLLIGSEPQSLKSRLESFGGNGLVFTQEAWPTFKSLEPDSSSSGISIDYDLSFYEGLFLAKIKNPDLPTSLSPVPVKSTGWITLFELENGQPGALYKKEKGKHLVWFNAPAKDKAFFKHPIAQLTLFRMMELVAGKSIVYNQPANSDTVLWNALVEKDSLPFIPTEESAEKGWKKEEFEEEIHPIVWLDSQGFTDSFVQVVKGKAWYKWFLIAGLLLLLLETFLIRKERNV